MRVLARVWRTLAAFGRFLRRDKKAMAGAIIIGVLALISAFPSWFVIHDPSAEVYTPGVGLSWSHPLGTTSFGQDVFSQLMAGTRESFLIAILVGAFTTIISVVIGLTAAYVGGFVDDGLSLLTDVVLVIPTFPLIIVITAYLKSATFWMMIFVLTFTGWSYGARQLRVQALSLRNRDYLLAARARGESAPYVVFVELLPPMTSLIVANFLSSALFAVLASAGLQFVGLGNINDQSWGTMLYWAQNNEALATGLPLWALMPGVAIAVLGTGFALLNYAFDEVANPALRPVRAAKRKGPATLAPALATRPAAGLAGPVAAVAPVEAP
ncbi:MAG TPA: ABC transporter permease [Acidimicrobiales bacterium]|nr:ABC transporter permease [Acidimicrobiales bacterium]